MKSIKRKQKRAVENKMGAMLGEFASILGDFLGGVMSAQKSDKIQQKKTSEQTSLEISKEISFKDLAILAGRRNNITDFTIKVFKNVNFNGATFESGSNLHRAYVNRNSSAYIKNVDPKKYVSPKTSADIFFAVVNSVVLNKFNSIINNNITVESIKSFIENKKNIKSPSSEYNELYDTLWEKYDKLNGHVLPLLNILIMCACVFNYKDTNGNQISQKIKQTYALQILNKDMKNTDILHVLLGGTVLAGLTNSELEFNLYNFGFQVINNYIDFILTHPKESPIIKFGDDATEYNTPFFGRKDELNQIKEYFDQGAHIVIISNSTGGVGKTALAEKFVSTSTNYKIKSKVFMRFNDYNQLVDPQCTTRWLAINNRLNIQFSVDTQNRINQLVSYQKMHGVSEPEANDSAITGILKEWDEKAILIIDNANNFDTGLLHDLNKILPNVKIIITTRQQNIKESNGVKILNLSDLDYENNYKVFCNYYTDKGIASSNEPYIKQIIDIFKNNTTAIISVAKHLKARNISVEKFNAIRENLLSYSNNGDNVIKDEAHKSHIIAKELADLFRITELDNTTYFEVFDRMRPILSIMMLVQQEQIIVKDLANMLSMEDNEINTTLTEMSDYGFIETSSFNIQDDTIICMHPIIALAFELYRDRNDKPLEISPETRACVAHHFLSQWSTLPDDLDTILRILSLTEKIEEDIPLPFPNSLTVSKNSTTLLDKDIDTSNIIYCYDDNNIQYKFKFIKSSNNSIILKPLNKIQDMDENSYLICNYDSSNRSISFQQPYITN